MQLRAKHPAKNRGNAGTTRGLLYLKLALFFSPPLLISKVTSLKKESIGSESVTVALQLLHSNDAPGTDWGRALSMTINPPHTKQDLISVLG